MKAKTELFSSSVERRQAERSEWSKDAELRGKVVGKERAKAKWLQFSASRRTGLRCVRQRREELDKKKKKTDQSEREREEKRGYTLGVAVNSWSARTWKTWSRKLMMMMMMMKMMEKKKMANQVECARKMGFLNTIEKFEFLKREQKRMQWKERRAGPCVCN